MTKLLLIRHGECELNAAGILNGQLDSCLTERGREQGRKLAARMGRHALWPAHGAVYSSDLSRAFETGCIVTGMHDMPPPLQLPVLRERHLGVVTGVNVRDAIAMIPDEHKITTPHGVTYAQAKEYEFETFDEATKRAQEFVDYVRRTHPDERAWAFTHGDIGIALIAAWTGRSMEELIHEIYFTNTDVVHLMSDGTYQKLPND